jgi:chemotaxis protein histidine kinase CheA
MPDSNAPKPRPSDDDESIDLGNLQPADEEASALSFSGTSGSASGGSSSGIRSWTDLVRGSGTESEPDIVRYDATANAEDVDPVSDQDLLREVLAGEPPPSKIELKDPSAGEMPALPAKPRQTSNSEFVLGDDVPTAKAVSNGPRSGAKLDPFELPPDLAVTRPGDSSSSILGHQPPVMPGQSGITSDVWGGSSSGVDLLRPGFPSDVSSGSMERTDEVDRPPMLGRPRGDSSFTRIGESLDDGDDSSAVDLGSQPMVDLPYPLGLDSSAGSSVMGPPRGGQSGHSASDSGAIDLLTQSEFDIGLPESNTTPSWAAAREDMPPTVPMVPAGKARLLAWGGGGLAGLLAGVAACAGLWMTGVVPNQSAKPIAPAGPSAADFAAIQAKADEVAKQAQQERDAEVAKAKVLAAEASKAKADLAQAARELALAKTAANEKKVAKEELDALAAKLKQANTARASLREANQKLTDAQAAADANARDAQANVARLREQVEKAGLDSQAARDALAKAETSGKRAAAFTAAVAQRLRAAPGAAATDLLAALDRALTHPAGESVAVAPSRPVAPATPLNTPEQMRQAAHAGFTALRSGDAYGAEREFARLATSPDGTAIHFYFLGLSQWKQGLFAEAENSFHRGWALEKESRPPPSQVDAAFERLNRNDRELVNRYRR